MLQAMNTGHEGSLSTVHANSPRDALAPHRDDGADGGLRPAGAGDPPAGLLGARPDRPPRAARGRLAPRHAHHRGAADGVRRDHAAGPLQVQDRVVRARPHDHRAAPARPGSARSSSTSSRSTASSCRRASSRTAPSRSNVAELRAVSRPRATHRRSRSSPPPRGDRRRLRGGAPPTQSGVQVVEAERAAVPGQGVRPLAARSRRSSALTTDESRSPRTASPSRTSPCSSAAAERQRHRPPDRRVEQHDGRRSTSDGGRARVRRRRNPGQPLARRLLQRRRHRRAAPDDRPQGGSTRRSRSRRARRRDPHQRRARRPRSRRCAGRRRRGAIVLLSDGDDVGSTTSHERRSRSQRAEDPRVRGRAPVGRVRPRTPRADRRRDRRHLRGASRRRHCTEIYGELGFKLANEYLLRYRSLAGPTRRSTSRQGRRQSEPARSRTRRPRGTAAPSSPSLWDRIVQSLAALIALVVGSWSRWRSSRSALLEPPVRTRRSSRRIGQFVTLPDEEQAAAARKEVDALARSRREREEAQAKDSWHRGFEEDVDLAQIDVRASRMILLSVARRARRSACRSRRSLIGPFWSSSRSCRRSRSRVGRAARRVASCGTTFADQLPDNLDVLASGAPRRPQPRRRPRRVVDEAPRAVEARVPARDRRRAARCAARRGTRT